MARLIPLLLALCLGGAAQAQDYLTEAEMTAILRDNALCYDAEPNGNCAWVERYHQPEGPGIALRLGLLTAPGEVFVIEQAATWIADAICIRDGDFGITASFGAQGALFRFDYGDHVAQDAAVTAETIAFLSADVQPKTCFRFARDPAVPGGLLQHTYANNQRQDGENRVRPVPLVQGSAPLSLP